MSNNTKEIGDRVWFIREFLELSQTDFGRKIGYASSIVSRWETGKSAPETRAILAICERFNVRREYLENGEEPYFKSQSVIPVKREVITPRPEQETDQDNVGKILDLVSGLSIQEIDGLVGKIFEHLNSRLHNVKVEWK